MDLQKYLSFIKKSVAQIDELRIMQSLPKDKPLAREDIVKVKISCDGKHHSFYTDITCSSQEIIYESIIKPALTLGLKDTIRLAVADFDNNPSKNARDLDGEIVSILQGKINDHH